MENNTKIANGSKPRLFKTMLAVLLAAAFVITVAVLAAYVAMQQPLRLSANMPQAQIAEDGAKAIAQGKPAEALAAGDKVDVSSSLAPFVIVYDADGNVLASSGQLNGAVPKLPAGVLDYTAKNGEDRVSWTPGGSVRIAAVVVHVEGGPGGAVLAGRNLKETEAVIEKTGLLLLALWAGSITLLLVAALITALLLKKRR